LIQLTPKEFIGEKLLRRGKDVNEKSLFPMKTLSSSMDGELMSRTLYISNFKFLWGLQCHKREGQLTQSLLREPLREIAFQHPLKASPSGR